MSLRVHRYRIPPPPHHHHYRRFIDTKEVGPALDALEATMCAIASKEFDAESLERPFLKAFKGAFEYAVEMVSIDA